MNKVRLAKFVGDDWADVLIPFFQSKEWLKIQDTLKHQMSNGTLICPAEKDLLRCFKECPLEKLHTIILVDECYNTFSIDYKNTKHQWADGIALSAKYLQHCPLALNHVFTELDYLYADKGEILSASENFDLKRWANQGILLLNCSLSTIAGATYTHTDLWRPFIVYVLSYLNAIKDRVGVIFMGEYAKQFKSIFDNDTFKLLDCENPLKTSYGRLWESNDVIKKLTEFQNLNKIKIDWS